MTIATALMASYPDDTGTGRLDGDDQLVIPGLTAEDARAEAFAVASRRRGTHRIALPGPH
jgi:hypothetical protein